MIILRLFWSFLKIGFTSFGGLSMIPLISDEMLSHGWMTATEVADIIAIAEMTPGPLGLNCATFAGTRVAGLAGAIASNLGILAPTLTVCAIAAVFFEKFKKSNILGGILVGIRPACIGLIWAVILNQSMQNYIIDGKPELICMGIGGVAAYLLLKRKWSIPLVILVAAVLGIAFGGFIGA